MTHDTNAQNLMTSNLCSKFWKSIVCILLALFVSSVAAENDSVFGTHWVKFEPLQIEGQLKGCSLVYLAVHADYVYLKGNQVIVNGSIQFSERQPGIMGLIFKIGLKDMSSLNSIFSPPIFAYIQSADTTTAMATQKSIDGDAGYKLFAYKLDSLTSKILVSLTVNEKIALGYNRIKGGTDVIVPLDLSVVDSEYTKDEKVIRKHSPKSTQDFADCVSMVLANAKDKLDLKAQ